jgi:hypothetical protein
MDMQSMLQKMKERANAQKSKPMKRPDRLMRSSAEGLTEETTTKDVNSIVDKKKIELDENSRAGQMANTSAPAPAPIEQQSTFATEALSVDSTLPTKVQVETVEDILLKKTLATSVEGSSSLPGEIQTDDSNRHKPNVEVKRSVDDLVAPTHPVGIKQDKVILDRMLGSEFSEKLIPVSPQQFEPSSNPVQTRFKNKEENQQVNLNPVQTRFKPSSAQTVDLLAQGDETKIDLNAQNEAPEANYSGPNISVVYSESESDTFEPSSNQVQTRFKNKFKSPSKPNPSPNNKLNENQTNDNQKNRTRFKPSSNQVQDEILSEFTEPINDKPSSEPGSNLVSTEFKVGSQLGSKFSLHKLSPLQISILKYLHSICEIERSDTTTPIKVIDIINHCQCTLEGAKTAIKRMLKSEIIKRTDYKDGRGGWCQYQIPEHIHSRILLDLKPSFNPVQTRFIPSSEPGSELGSSVPSKLVSNLNNNLLTKEASSNPALDVTAINFQHLSKFGITRKQIQDIANQKLDFTTHTLQDFADRFLVYVSDPKNIRGVNSVPGIFVKMAQLASKGQDPLIDIETDTDRLVKERIERLKAMQEDRLRQENELVGLEFENWYSCLTKSQMDNAAPPTPASKSGSSTQKIILKNYFLENVWPEKRTLVYGSPNSAPTDFSDLLGV